MGAKTETVIEPTTGFAKFNFAELAAHRDLLVLLVKKELSAKFRQTLLGPLWFLLQPVLLTLVYLLLLDRIAMVPYGQVPAHLFLLLSVPLWNYFAQSLSAVAEGLNTHVALLNKVHFPRLVIPLTALIWRLVPLSLQLLLFLGVAFFSEKLLAPPVWVALVFPVLLLHLALLALGIGLGIASLSIRYKDLQHLFPFLLQLALFATPVLYPATALPNGFRWLAEWNPVAPLLETLRALVFQAHFPSLESYLFSLLSTVVILLVALIRFQTVERTFVDTL